MRILVAYDASACAAAAVDDLRRAGLPACADALVLSVADLVPIPEESYDPRASPWVRQWRAARRRAAADAASWAEKGRARLARRFPSWRISAETRADSPAWAIVERARTWKADLVVVGSHGRSALGRAWFGSVAQTVVHHAPCGVRVGRPATARSRSRGVRVVVGADGSRGATKAAAAAAARTWPAGGAVRVVVAVDAAMRAAGVDPQAAARDAADGFAELGVDLSWIVVDGDAKRALVAQAAAFRADVVFVGSAGRHGARRRFLGGVAAAVAARAKCSVEVVHAG